MGYIGFTTKYEEPIELHEFLEKHIKETYPRGLIVVKRSITDIPYTANAIIFSGPWSKSDMEGSIKTRQEMQDYIAMERINGNYNKFAYQLFCDGKYKGFTLAETDGVKGAMFCPFCGGLHIKNQGRAIKPIDETSHINWDNVIQIKYECQKCQNIFYVSA